MAFLDIEYNSKILGMERRVSVIYPDASEIDPDQVDDQDIPVLYLCMGWAEMKILGKSERILNAYCAIRISLL